MQAKMKYILRLLIIILLNVCIVGIIGYTYSQPREPKTVQALSKLGSRGDEVRQIQQKLSDLGYDIGAVDGIFGGKTVTAVKSFQRSRGLTVDGIAGPVTLKALGIAGQNTAGAGMSDSDYQLLARLISAESRGEPYSCQVAVGAVILNRLEHPSFPDSIPGVAYQPDSFTAMTDGQIDQPIAESAYRAAKEALNGSDPSGGAIYYYNPGRATNQWIRSRPVIKIIGQHTFCS